MKDLAQGQNQMLQMTQLTAASSALIPPTAQVEQMVREDMQVDQEEAAPTSPDSQWSAVSDPSANPNANDLP